MPHGVIRTERLVLRPLAGDDLDAHATMYADEEAARFIGGVARRDGLAAWLARRSADYELGELGRARLIALVDPLNVRSVRVAERLGMSPEREVEFHGNRVLLYALNV